ncbi:uncharacterized protein HD556DRAFT_1309765 [Suillus plorans]|uniref:Uncharacterized protein n=1 Tax=Suillus plorans TaxID=116603 RepID=A0A9P7DFT2_9AGAM|nr:uncharacterized protein HD556DRAFT_1309765 [Suillus plorans]KAG1791700.1 hypothetical protein HD556DRAFT_1309765 [Suillus plorans]
MFVVGVDLPDLRGRWTQQLLSAPLGWEHLASCRPMSWPKPAPIKPGLAKPNDLKRLNQVRAHPAIPNHDCCKPPSPAHFDVAFVVEDHQLWESGTGLDGLRLAQIRAIFKLPSHYSKFPHSLAYVEWFRPLRDLELVTNLYRLARLTRNQRHFTSVISVRDLLQAAHLMPSCIAITWPFALTTRLPTAMEHKDAFTPMLEGACWAPQLRGTHSCASKCKELGIETHLQANKMRSSYAGHVHRGHEWLASHFDAPSCSADEGDCSVPKEPSVQPVALNNPDSNVYADPAFKDAFGCMPNRCLDKALALFMSLKGFHENLSKNTVKSIRAAFKKLWEQADSGTFRGKWSFNEARQHWEGNPADSAEVYDMMASVKHKASAEGGDRTHSMAMTKDFMDRMLQWHEAACPLEIALQAIQLVMSGTLPSQVLSRLPKLICFELVKLQRKDVSLDTILLDTVVKKYIAHEPLTLSDSNTYFEIFLSNRKGWQKRVDKGICEADLRSNHYKIFPHPDMPSCDSFIWMLLWIKWLEFFHYGRTLRPNNFIFPSMGANGIMQPGQPLSHDTVQKWINEATTGAGILGCFSTHCFCCGGAQYWFMFAPVGWADGEQRNMLICYLLDELHTYETDYSDALAPFSCKAKSSLAGEQALVRPASTEELRMVHASVTADVNRLRVDVSAVNDLLRSLTSMVQATSSCLKAAGHLHLPHLTMATQLEEDPCFTLLSASSAESPHSISTPRHVHPPATHSHPLSSVHRSHGHAHITPTTQPLPSAAASTQQLPSNGLIIPRLPLVCLNGLKNPKAESWKDIIMHWLVGDPDRGLKTLLKDWPQEWYQGPNWKLAMQFQNRAVVACEFINQMGRAEGQAR